MHYVEIKILGRWMPRTYARKPVVENGYLVKKASGTRVPARALAKISTSLRHLTIDELRELYGPDGRFAKMHAQTDRAGR